MRRPAVVAAIAIAIVVGGCGGSGGSGNDGHDHGGAESSPATAKPAFAKADATTALDVTLQDYAFVGIPDTVTGPKVYFATTIKGSSSHELVLFDERGEAVGDVRPFEAPAHPALAVELAPGTYVAKCLVKEGSRTHADLGMRKTFVVSS
jgi:hypothetical protein